MALDSSATPTAVPAVAEPPGLGELFVEFAKMSLSGFGGVLVFARRAIVERHRWMTAEEFNETFALCHFMPGPNIVNLSMVFGARFRGVPGAFAAFTGLIGPPVVVMTILAALYVHFGELGALRRALGGVACVAVGLLFAVSFKMLVPLLRRRDPVAVLLLAAVFVAVGLLRWPMPWVLAVAIPGSILVTWLRRRSA
ncbi:chromate transporter [Rhodopseudomonas sp. B29]|uniref:chromate transporter n=1 Tax=Rhodopseudomonas sp. B29 TaxID=95607 RepID=UPI0003B35E87|nr:chromate transporter [Rhodopseudomonas sp. B29]